MSQGGDKLSSPSDVSPAREPPRFGGIRLGPPLAVAIYVLLVASAALALWVRTAAGRVPLGVALAAPWVFLGFVAVFGFYRLGLVRAGKYPAAKALVQVGGALIIFMLLLPSARFGFGQFQFGQTQSSDVRRLLRDPNPTVRALAAEVAGYRPDGARAAPELVKALSDPDPRVRDEAHASLVRLTGEDLGPASDKAAVKAWRERYP
jgi:hypothetical protein